jgi:type VI secretion system protein ImpK
MHESMQERMYWVCADAISLATQLGTAHDLPAPDVLRQRVASLFQQMREKGRDAGIPVDDTNEATYALAAFMDEQILRSPWPGRQQWMSQPLQLAFFQENTAGHGFFVRMQALSGMPGREHVLQIYALCIALGFQGQYALSATGELVDLQDRALATASRNLVPSEVLSPEGYPKRGLDALREKRVPVLMAGFGLLGLCIVLFVVLRVLLSMNIGSTEDEIAGEARAAGDGVVQVGTEVRAC